MAVVTMRQLLESGVHFGHQTRRWNPKMKRFIMTERNGIYIIDLQQSLTYINNAYEFVKETVAHGGTILFVGTKKQAQEPIAEQATRVGMPYVNHRWLGGMLTNFQTISKRLTRLKELEELDFDDVAGSGCTKKELLILKREKIKLERTLGGIRTWPRSPRPCGSSTPRRSTSRSTRRASSGCPVIAILDTNCDPDEVDYKIPGNDDAIRSVTLLTRVIADAVADGLDARAPSGKSGAGEGSRRRRAAGRVGARAPTVRPRAAETAGTAEAAARRGPGRGRRRRDAAAEARLPRTPPRRRRRGAAPPRRRRRRPAASRPPPRPRAADADGRCRAGLTVLAPARPR